MDDAIFVKQGLVIPAHELDYTTSRSGGPGGQHANKTSSRVTLSWNIVDTQSVPQSLKDRLLLKLDSRLTQLGELKVNVDTHRSQHQNKDEAQKRLAKLVLDALHVPKRRKKTKPTRGSQRRRLKTKKARGDLKKTRKKVNH